MTTIQKETLTPSDVASRLADITLSYGGRQYTKDGICAMEVVSCIAGEPFSAHPNCACPMVSTFMIGFNDSLTSNKDRDLWLKPLIPYIIDSKVLLENGHEDMDVQIKRAIIAGDFVLRKFVPFTLDMASESFSKGSDLDSERSNARLASFGAATLRALPEQTTFKGLRTTALKVLTKLSKLTDVIGLGYSYASPSVISLVSLITPIDVATPHTFINIAEVAAREAMAVLVALADTAALAKRDTENGHDWFASLATLTNLVNRSAKLAFADQADQINETRVAVALKMLAVKGNVSVNVEAT